MKNHVIFTVSFFMILKFGYGQIVTSEDFRNYYINNLLDLRDDFRDSIKVRQSIIHHRDFVKKIIAFVTAFTERY